MPRRILQTVKYGLVSIAVIGVTLLGVRAYDASKFPDLQPWHKYVPRELPRAELERAGWTEYLKAEEQIFAAVRENVTKRLPAEVALASNRYYENGPLYPGRFAQDWNRSYVLEPAGKPVGAVVFLHGLTDSPYSLRHIARRYTQRGFVSIAIRLPAHGTVPGGLTRVQWEDWSAATRLAVREARRRTDPSAPLHLVGFSNGGALAMKYALDALEDKELARPDRIVLVSPMIGITRFARFARLAGLPAVLPSFAKAAWLSVVPEFNPFKYNSFPVNGARQSYRLTRALQQQIEDLSQAGRLTELPPVITFQSVLDFTVSTPAILSALYAHLPDNGSEIVLFDVNRTIKFGPLLRASSDNALARLMPKSPQTYRFTAIANVSPDSTATVERTIAPNQSGEQTRPLELPYPGEIFSLSHVAVPFPLNDPLYGLQPDPNGDEQFGVSLGTLSARGERGALIVDADFLFRIASNPFFPYMLERIEQGITASKASASKPTAPHSVPRLRDAEAEETFPAEVETSQAGP